MSNNKVELTAENLSDILGGMNLVDNGTEKYITKRNGGTHYYFSDRKALISYVSTNYDSSIDIDVAEDQIISQMLDAGIIRLEE